MNAWKVGWTKNEWIRCELILEYENMFIFAIDMMQVKVGRGTKKNRKKIENTQSARKTKLAIFFSL